MLIQIEQSRRRRVDSVPVNLESTSYLVMITEVLTQRLSPEITSVVGWRLQKLRNGRANGGLPVNSPTYACTLETILTVEIWLGALAYQKKSYQGYGTWKFLTN